MDGPRGIGGWLLLPILGLVLSPVRLLIVFVEDYSPYILHAQALAAQGQVLTGPLAFEMAFTFVLAALDVGALYLLHKRSRSFPRMMILLYGCHAAFTLFATLLGVQQRGWFDWLGADRETLRAAAGAAVWIPYFRRSKRVRNTFGA